MMVSDTDINFLSNFFYIFFQERFTSIKAYATISKDT